MPRKPELRGRAARLARLFPAGRARAARTPFVLLVVLLLGGGLIGLLVLNSALSEGSFKLADLQKRTKNLTDEEQALQRDIDAYSSPDALQRRARELGMVPGGDPAFLAPDGTVKGVPGVAAPESAALTGPPAPESLVLTPPPGLPATPDGPQDPARSQDPAAQDGAAPNLTTPQSAPTPTTPGR
ncbi:septum formation initiator family protein [Streptomyces sp. NEAU-sy36]|uniref:septum formation initiator family protein n=1 Tax=unclassified Streptomyces TaxID=2593676 RepID=UPI0015D6235B|nr:MULTISPECIES: septum formation initiator family protein [unclassified Streptomyces]QLJ00869.1 septum formation initiator family protein [Streptomyces sp. NEAU-sy36]